MTSLISSFSFDNFCDDDKQRVFVFNLQIFMLNDLVLNLSLNFQKFIFVQIVEVAANKWYHIPNYAFNSEKLKQHSMKKYFDRFCMKRICSYFKYFWKGVVTFLVFKFWYIKYWIRYFYFFKYQNWIVWLTLNCGIFSKILQFS